MVNFIARGMDMTSQKLDVLRGLDGFEHELIKNLTPDSTEELAMIGQNIPAGRCVSRTGVNGETTLGCKGRSVPYFTFRGSAQPSTGAVSDPQPVQLAPHVTWKSDAEHKVLCYAGIEGLELATTEFVAGTYAIGDYLVAPTVAAVGLAITNGVTDAGKVTNQVGAVAPAYGRDPIVGIVSEAAFRKPHRVDMLVFYSLYRPAIEQLSNALPAAAAPLAL